jgi:hypothetical protein
MLDQQQILIHVLNNICQENANSPNQGYRLKLYTLNYSQRILRQENVNTKLKAGKVD